MYLAPACFLWLMAGVALVEWPAMRDNNALQLMVNKPFWYFAAAAMGFCVNLLAYMVIQTASSLTLKVRLLPHCLRLAGLPTKHIDIWRLLCAQLLVLLLLKHWLDGIVLYQMHQL